MYQEGRFALSNLLVALKVKDERKCDPHYLYHLLMARKNDLLVPLMRGTSNVALKTGDIQRVTIPLPPLAQQRRLVARIKALAGFIAEANQLRNDVLANLQAMLHAVFQKTLEGALWKQMRDVAPQVRRPINLVTDGNYAELGIRSFGKGTFHKPTLSGFDIGNKRIFQIEPDDLMFSNVFAWEGAIAVAKPQDARRVGSHRFITCVPKPDVALSSYLCFYFLTEDGMTKIRAGSPGGAGRNRTLGIGALSDMTVPIPSIEKQRWFAGLQAEVDGLKLLQAETQAELDALLPAVLELTFNTSSTKSYPEPVMELAMAAEANAAYKKKSSK